MKPIAILGCGPSAMLAAHACYLAGRPVAMFSKSPSPSKLGGAQFLHSAIPDLTDRESDAVITYRRRGDEEGYRAKVYGDQKPSFVSFSHVQDGETQDAWNLIDVYTRLWDNMGESLINDVSVDATWLDKHKWSFDLVISTIPAMCICHNPLGPSGPNDPNATIHTFSSGQVQIRNVNHEPMPDNTIVYDGTPERTWYRSSKLFGVEGTEWGPDVLLPFPEVVKVSKPLSTNCDCFPEVIKVGRFGSWKKGELVNDAFFRSLVAIKERYS